MNKITRFISSASDIQVFLILILIQLIKTGVWVIPNIGLSFVISRDLTKNPFSDPNAHYLMWSYLGPVLAHLLSIDTLSGFILMHLLLTLAGVVIYFSGLRKTYGALPCLKKSLIVYFSFPVAGTIWYWVGMDGITFLLMASILVFNRHWFIVLPLSILLGVNHFEQGFLGFFLLFIGVTIVRLREIKTSVSPRWCLLVLLGVIIGKGLLAYWFFTHELIVLGRFYWLKQHFTMMLKQWFTHPHVILFSLFGTGWFFVLVAWKRLENVRAALLLTLVTLTALSLVSADQTRVIALISFPFLHVFLIANEDFLSTINEKEFAAFLIAWILVPWAWCWGGDPKVSAFPFDLMWIADHLFGNNLLPKDILAPFR